MKQIFSICLLLLLSWSCRNRDKQSGPVAADQVSEEEIMAWKENDTLRSSSQLSGLQTWLEYYGSSDKRFSLTHFKASGVVLHWGGLEEAMTNGDQQAMSPYFIHSPDSSRYRDLFSYDHFMDKGMLVDGEADQQVVIAQPSRNIRKQLLYSGPSQSADIADWLGNDAFVIGLTSISEDGKKLGAQLLVFRISDSSYTNFNLDHSFPLDSLRTGPQSFGEIYIEKLRSR
jgi:hypothetical protein